MNDKWINWVSELQSVAQAGLTFAENQYDIDRYKQISALAVEILHEYTDLSHEKIRDLFTSDSGYQTPKVDIRAAVFKGDEILMVKEKADNAWSLPGGWADVNSSVSESAIRECLEEAGAIVKPKRIIAVHLANKHNNSRFPYTIYKIFVECHLIDNKFIENTETLDARFYSVNSLPTLSTNRNSRSQIEMCFEAKNCKTFETIFD